MATLTTQDRAELIVTRDGVVQPITPGSVVVTSGAEFLGWSPIYGNGQLDVLGQAPGTAVVVVTLGASSGELEIIVTEDEPGELVITLGPVRPK